MASSDVIVIGAGLVGLALARELHRQGFQVTILEAGLAGREASWAGAGMLAAYQTAHPATRPLAIASARLYPTWVRELEAETYLNVGYRRSGTLLLAAPESQPTPLSGWERVSAAALPAMEPELACPAAAQVWRIADDHSVDNRALTAALIASVRARGIALHEDARVLAVAPGRGGLAVQCEQATHSATLVVNAAGAWASAIAAPVLVEVRPRKGQMIRLRSDPAHPIHHVIEGPEVYLVPRAPGQTVVGATLEDVGFDPEISSTRTVEFQQRAAALVPALAGAEVVEQWIGFRPCTPHQLPVFGPTACPGYWLAAGHFRDGILLAPITAKILARAMATGHLTRALDLQPFLPQPSA